MLPGTHGDFTEQESKRKTLTTNAFHNRDRLVGKDAQTLGLHFPANNSYYAYLLGKTVDGPMVELYR